MTSVKNSETVIKYKHGKLCFTNAFYGKRCSVHAAFRHWWLYIVLIYIVADEKLVSSRVKRQAYE